MGANADIQQLVWCPQPLDVAFFLGDSAATTMAPFSQVAAYTRFGDLLLRDPSSHEFGIFLQGSSTYSGTGFFDDAEFTQEYLGQPEIIHHLLRPSDIEVLAARLGDLGQLEVYFPSPIPALGGSDRLDTYKRGGIREYLSFVVQTLGIAEELRA